MSLTKTLRKKAASSVSSLDIPEQFHWHKWLRLGAAPEYYELPPLIYRLMETSRLNKWMVIPESSFYKPKLFKARLPKVSKIFLILPTKTNAVYFGSGKPAVKKVGLPAFEQTENFFSFTQKRNKNSIEYIINFRGNYKTIFPQTSTKRLDRFFFDMNITADKYEFILYNADTSLIKFHYSRLATKNIDLYSYAKIKNTPNFNLKVPDITDYLASLNTIIHNVEILRSENNAVQFNSEHSQILFNSLENNPKVYRAKSIEINTTLKNGNILLPIGNNFSTTLYPLSSIKSCLLSGVKDIITLSGSKISYIRNIIENLTATFDNIHTRNLLNDKTEMILEPKINLGNEEQKEIFKNLYTYQEAASLFLVENKHGLICEQLGMGKTVEVCAALKVLNKTHQLKRVLIIAPEETLGDSKLSDATGEHIGWFGHLNKWFPAVEIKIIDGDRQERREKWQAPVYFNIINFRHFKDDLVETLSDGKYLAAYDCIIVDEVQEFEKEKYLNHFVRIVNPKNFWFTSSLPYSNIANIFKFDKKVSVEIDAVFENRHERKKEEVTESIPDVLRQDVWLELDGEQQYEYNVALSNARTQIGELYSSGNPYRFQAKVFFLLHQLKQICNFVGENINSPKAALLIKHLDLILGSGQKVLIFTQYDKFGTQKIENILQEKGIKYSSYLAGMTVPEMEIAILNFRKDKNIQVFLAGLRAAGVRENIAEVPYVIHFDQWWNPVTHWQIENRVNHPEDKKIKVTNLNVYNYLVRNTFEEKLKIKLAHKGLLEKNIIESLSAEALTKLIRDDEWLEILGIVEKDESRVRPAVKDPACIAAPEKFFEQTKVFFTILGYKALKVDRTAKEEKVIIQGSSIGKNKQINMVAACYANPDLPATSIKDFIELIEKNKNVDKIFIIVNGEYKVKSKLTLNKNVTFLDGGSFQNYIDEFQIIT